MNGNISFRHLFLVLPLAQLLAVTQGKTVVLGKAGDSVELPCTTSPRKNPQFSWKNSHGITILGLTNTYLIKGPSYLKDRVDTKQSLWGQGSFPLIIYKLEMRDSGTYICEQKDMRMEVELQVFKVTIHPDTRVLQGQSLTLTLESSSGNNRSMRCKRPGNRILNGTEVVVVPKLEFRDSGTWLCTVTQDKKELMFEINISVLGLQNTSNTLYKKEGEPVEFSFPLNFEEESLRGELRWQAENASAFQSWITFSLENKKVSVQKSIHDPNLQLAETLPLHLKLPLALPKYAGSGTLTLTLAKGTLRQEVGLVVMRVTQSQNSLICEVWGPTSPKLNLNLKLEDQETSVSKQEKVIQVLAPEVGKWHCTLSDGNKIVLDSMVEVFPTGLNQDQPMFLAIVLGSTLGFLVFVLFCVFCCVKCRNKRRQEERMSQIKRLLSEKKTCQCPHRLQKTQSLF